MSQKNVRAEVDSAQCRHLLVTMYDTAWVSTVQKLDGTWLSPESFDFSLALQIHCGSWKSYASSVDVILDTDAALLALKKRL